VGTPSLTARAFRGAIAVIATALVLSNAATAFADPAPVEEGARQHYRRGTAAYNLGNYQEAAKEYEQAYGATLDPALLFNIAQSYRLAGDRKKAITTYRSYLRSAPKGDQRHLAELKLKELESQPNADQPATGTATPPSYHPITAPLAPVSPPFLPPAAPPTSTFATDTSTPAPSPPAGLTLDSTPAALTLEREAAPPLYKRWPFWAVTGAAVVAIVVGTIVLTGGSSNPSPDTDLGTMRFR
jgi:tetratricopeptide (TPR) repeat protein